MLDLDFASSLNANETSWAGYRDLPPQIRFFCSVSVCGVLSCVCVLPPCLLVLFPSNHLFQTGGDCAW